jgi:hypothetical protein
VQVSILSTAGVTVPGAEFDAFRSGRPSPDGSFSFASVSPGQYSVLARGTIPGDSGPPRVFWAMSDLYLQGEPVSQVALSLAPSLTMSGVVKFESVEGRASPPAAAARVILIPIQAAGAVSISQSDAAVTSDGRFQFSGVTPGRYRLSAQFPGPAAKNPWMLRGATVAGLDAADQSLVVQAGQNLTGAVVTFTDRLAEIDGRFQTARGEAAADYTIVLFPADRSMWVPQTRRIQVARPAADGAYAFRNLPAGSYLIAAVEDVEPGEWSDPTYLQGLAGGAIPITVSDGEKKIQDVRVGGAP